MYYIYSRKSKYTGKGESIENQIEIEYLRSHIKDIDESEIIVYEDEGFSAKNLHRPMFKKMIADSQKEKVEYIVCYRLDRISRNVSDFSSLITDLNNRNISFVSVKEQFDTSSPMGRAMMYNRVGVCPARKRNNRRENPRQYADARKDRAVARWNRANRL